MSPVAPESDECRKTSHANDPQNQHPAQKRREDARNRGSDSGVLRGRCEVLRAAVKRSVPLQSSKL
jgi:hypothetical protein